MSPPVALVTIADLTLPSGIARNVRLLERGLEDRGFDVRLVARSLTEGVERTLARRVIRRISHSTEETLRIRRALADVESAARELAPETICVCFDAWTASASVRAGRRAVYRMGGFGSVTDEWVRNGFVTSTSLLVPYLRTREEEGLLQAERVVLLSDTLRPTVRAMGVADDRIVVIPNGFALPPAAPPKSPGPVRLLTVGNLRHVKGADVLAKAVLVLPEEQRRLLHVVHVGDGNEPGNPTYEWAARLLEGAGVSHEFRGSLTPDEVAAELSRADVFVLPSRVDMFPNALVEAMAAGLSVVATDVGAVSEILGEEAVRSGAVVPAEDAAALAAALRKRVAEPDVRAVEGAAHRRRVAEHFTLDACVDRYADLLRACASS